jgi:hypothetical protein
MRTVEHAIDIWDLAGMDPGLTRECFMSICGNSNTSVGSSFGWALTLTSRIIVDRVISSSLSESPRASPRRQSAAAELSSSLSSSARAAAAKRFAGDAAR